MKTRMNILTLACALTCFSCIGTAHTIQPSKNYQTEKRSLGDIREVSTLSSCGVSSDFRQSVCRNLCFRQCHALCGTEGVKR